MSHARDGQWVLINWEMDFAVAEKRFYYFSFIPLPNAIFIGWFGEEEKGKDIKMVELNK